MELWSILATVGWVLLWILVGLLGMLFLLVALPFHLRAQGRVGEAGVDGEVRGSWAWYALYIKLSPAGLRLYILGIRIWTFRLGDEDKAPDKKKKDPEPEDKEKKPRKKMGWLWTHRQTLKRLMGKLVRSFRLRLRVQGVVGLGDPAETSMAQQLWSAADRISPAIDIDIEPEWLDEELELDGEFRARLWLLHLGLIALGSLFRKDTRMMLRAARAA